MSHQDQVFMRTFTIVLVILAVMGLVFYFIAQNISSKSAADTSKMAEKAIQERIAPVGKVTVGSASAAAGAGAARPVEVVMATCGGCHNTGAIGAPKTGNKADWAPRIKNGIDALVKSAIAGKGAMPPRGGGNFTEAEIKAAIEFMNK